jgi:hypothetical protein
VYELVPDQINGTRLVQALTPAKFHTGDNDNTQTDNGPKQVPCDEPKLLKLDGPLAIHRACLRYAVQFHT